MKKLPVHYRTYHDPSGNYNSFNEKNLITASIFSDRTFLRIYVADCVYYSRHYEGPTFFVYFLERNNEACVFNFLRSVSL